MAEKQSNIPMHRLDEATVEGFQLEKVYWEGEGKTHFLLSSHRDDHYIFFVQLSGMSKGMIDFESFTLLNNMVCYILPGEVHSYEGADLGTSGWFVALDPGLIPDAFRAVLENPLLAIRPLELSEEEMAPLIQSLELMHVLRQRPESSYSRQAVYSMLASFSAMFADLYACQRCIPLDKMSRTQNIMLEFKKLLAVEYKRLKSSGEYAGALHISTSYLNEAVKETTGFSVSYWIQQHIVLEAKRLLYYSQCSVKEIAHELGYEDHTYFSRIFKKVVGRTPMAFRTEFGMAQPRH
jgi:AraC family transcriptional activator of pobA